MKFINEINDIAGNLEISREERQNNLLALVTNICKEAHELTPQSLDLIINHLLIVQNYIGYNNGYEAGYKGGVAGYKKNNN